MARTCWDCGRNTSKASGNNHEHCKPEDKPSMTDKVGYEMTFVEIANALGLSRQTVINIYDSAIAKMRRAMKREKLV